MWQRCWPVLCLLFVSSPLVRAEQIPGRYIVELSSDPVAEHVAVAPFQKQSMRSAAAVAHRARIESEQTEVTNRIRRTSARVLDSVNTVANALFVETQDPSTLAGLPGVRKVYPVRKVKLLLDRAVVLHRVTEAWNQIGVDRAGSGVRIGIIDTGVDPTHPGLAQSSLRAPETFPRSTSDSDLEFTNGKVIVARSYVNLLPNRDSDLSARDRVGHGTALAMISAGVRTTAPLATITGVAPQAWIGNYKVFGSPGVNDDSSNDAIIKAIDDAVADGMDIISLSVGSDTAPRLADDPEVAAVERASRAGVIVVAAAGNNGPDLNTMSSPATALSVIAVGATTSDRAFATNVQLSGQAPVLAISGDGPAPSGEITAPLTDVSSIDGSGQACDALREGSLTGTVALIRRGSCTFETKLLNAQAAGAVGGIITALADNPDPSGMITGTATLPAQMVSYDAGEAIRAALASGGANTVSMRFTPGPLGLTPNLLTTFSGSGPNVDGGIKPDVMAVGANSYTATQTFDRRGDMYDASGYIAVNGTSFSTPLVAGVAALLKSARPGLTVDQYRSLIINTARTLTTRDGRPARVQSGGAGLVDADAALRASGAVAPVSVSFGSGSGTASFTRTIRVTNLSGSTEVWSIAVESASCSSLPLVSNSTVRVGANATISINVTWNPVNLPSGACEGAFRLTGTGSGTELHLPWWYAVESSEPRAITTLDITESGRRGSLVRNAALFRVTDGAGLPLSAITPEVNVISGSGSVVEVNNYDSDIPGMFGINVRLGAVPGPNTFEIVVGDVKRQISITGN